MGRMKTSFFRTKHVKLKSMENITKGACYKMAKQNMCKHATYSTDKISSSYLFVFCVRLKTFQPPLVGIPTYLQGAAGI